MELALVVCKPGPTTVLGVTCELDPCGDVVVTEVHGRAACVLQIGDVIRAVDDCAAQSPRQVAGLLRAAAGCVRLSVVRRADECIVRRADVPAEREHGAGAPVASSSQASTDDDVTAWRAGGASSEGDAEGDGLLDARVESALEALNEAIAANNAVEGAFEARRQQREAQQREAEGELKALETSLRPQLRALEEFRTAQRHAEAAVAELVCAHLLWKRTQSRACAHNDARTSRPRGAGARQRQAGGGGVRRPARRTAHNHPGMSHT